MLRRRIPSIAAALKLKHNTDLTLYFKAFFIETTVRKGGMR